MTGRVAAVFDINANVEGSFDTGIVSLLECMSIWNFIDDSTDVYQPVFLASVILGQHQPSALRMAAELLAAF